MRAGGVCWKWWDGGRRGVGGDYIAGRRKGWEGLNGSKLVNWGHRDKGWTCKLSWV